MSPELPPVDLPATFLPTISKPPFQFPASSPLYSPDTGPGTKRRHGEDAEDKKARLCPGAKRRPGKKTAAVNDETSSPVSGTVIRQLGEGEALPEIRKGEHLSHVHSCHGENINMTEKCVWWPVHNQHTCTWLLVLSCYIQPTRGMCHYVTRKPA